MQRRWIVVAVVVLCLLMAGPFWPRLVRIEGRAMEPALADQDRVLVNHWAYFFSPPRTGDVVLLRYPPNQNRLFIKRIVAQGGDTLRIEDGRVFVNDRLLEDAYVDPAGRSHDALGLQRIPAGYYFVLGDRRNNSSDSRHWGLVQEDLVVGRVSLRLWPNVGILR